MDYVIVDSFIYLLILSTNIHRVPTICQRQALGFSSEQGGERQFLRHADCGKSMQLDAEEDEWEGWDLKSLFLYGYDKCKMPLLGSWAQFQHVCWAWGVEERLPHNTKQFLDTSRVSENSTPI